MRSLARRIHRRPILGFPDACSTSQQVGSPGRERIAQRSFIYRNTPPDNRIIFHPSPYADHAPKQQGIQESAPLWEMGSKENEHRPTNRSCLRCSLASRSISFSREPGKRRGQAHPSPQKHMQHCNAQKQTAPEKRQLLVVARYRMLTVRLYQDTSSLPTSPQEKTS